MHQVRNCSLGYLDSQFMQLAVNPGSAPERIGLRHLKNKVTDFRADRRPSGTFTLGLELRKQLETLFVPPNDSFGLDDDQWLLPVATEIHAHPVDEALTLEEGLLPIMLAGDLSSGEAWESEIFLPHPYTFATMKLFAFRDRLDDPNKEFGRYHALDLYTILATTTEKEWEYALHLRN